MSRSWKHTPVFKDRNPFMKKYFNRKLRRKGLEEVPNGMGYRRMNDPWSISDYGWRYTEQEYIQREQDRMRYIEERDLTEHEIQEAKNDWAKYHKRK